MVKLSCIVNVFYIEWKATAIGRNMKNAKTILEKRYSPDIQLEDAIHTALFALKDGFEGYTNTQLLILLLG